MEEANPKVEQRYPFQPPQAWAAPIPKRRRLSGPAVIGIAVGGVVAMMVVVFVLAAIAIPVFLNQRAKAQMAELGDPWSQVVASEGAWAQSYQDLAAVSASESSTFEDVVAAVAEYETALSLFEGSFAAFTGEGNSIAFPAASRPGVPSAVDYARVTDSGVVVLAVARGQADMLTACMKDSADAGTMKPRQPPTRTVAATAQQFADAANFFAAVLPSAARPSPPVSMSSPVTPGAPHEPGAGTPRFGLRGGSGSADGQVMTSPASIPAGWYGDPQTRANSLRYWNGSTWTEHVTPRVQATAAPAAGWGAQSAGGTSTMTGVGQSPRDAMHWLVLHWATVAEHRGALRRAHLPCAVLPRPRGHRPGCRGGACGESHVSCTVGDAPSSGS